MAGAIAAARPEPRVLALHALASERIAARSGSPGCRASELAAEVPALMQSLAPAADRAPAAG